MDSLDSTIGTRPGSKEVGDLDPIIEKEESRRSPEPPETISNDNEKHATVSV